MTLSRHEILLVEDDESDVMLFEYALKKSPPKFLHVAPDADSALAYFEGRGIFQDRSRYPLPSFVFLDLNLSGQSGFEVLTWIRQSPKLRRLPVIVLTASDLTLDIYRAYELGANSYIPKPVTSQGLLAATAKLQQRRVTPLEKPPRNRSSVLEVPC